MFIVPLDAPPEVKQVAPQVFVTVQQALGMPEWVKIIISAAVGAFFALAGALVTEYLKPWIARRHARKNMIPQLNDELLGNVDHIEHAKKVLKLADGKDKFRQTMAGLFFAIMKRDRFDYFFSEYKALVYEYDKSLIDFYNLIPSVQTFLQYNGEGEIPKMVSIADELAQRYLKTHNLTYAPKINRAGE